MTKPQATFILTACLVAFLASLSLAYTAGRWTENQSVQRLMSLVKSQHEEIELVKNQHLTAEEAIIKLTDDKTDLLSLVKELQAKPADIKYITRVETILKPQEPVYISSSLPPSYVHKVRNIPVAKFERLGEEFKFETYELKFRNTLVMTENKTGVLLQMESSGEPGVYHEIPVEVTSVNTTKHKVLAPQLALGITASAPVFDLGGSVIVSWLHPTKSIDVASPRITASSKAFQVGLDVVSYNVGEPLPVLSDLWIAVGISTTHELKPNGNITISTKF